MPKYIGMRDLARKEAELGIAHLARAFNATNNPDLPYSWSSDTLERFEALAKEVITLMECGDVRQRSGATAQEDHQFQKFLNLVIG
jgi:hypothetical protein